MFKILWWDGKRHAGSVWTADPNDVETLAEALRLAGWKVVATLHTTDSAAPVRGYEAALKEWQNLR